MRFDEAELDRLHAQYDAAEAQGYSTVGSMASAYAEAMESTGQSGWLPNKPIW